MPRTSPLVVTMLVLTFTSGMVDAVGYVALGRVFTALMTGNIAFIGMALAGLEGVSASRSIAALLAFGVGAAAGGRLAYTCRHATHRRWLSWACTLEVLGLLGAVGFARALDSRSTHDVDDGALFGVIVCTAVAMGIRSSTTLRLAVPDLKTTVLTLTVANLAADSPLAGGTSPRLRRRVASILSLMVGAGTGVALLPLGTWVPLAVCALLVVSATLIYVRHPDSASHVGRLGVVPTTR